MTSTQVSERPAQDTVTRVGTVIIGSGFAGIAMAVRLLRDGDRDFVLLERGDEVGGTWRDNTYPGAACDVPSHLYSFSFAPNPDWSHSFSFQPEIQAYLVRVARRFALHDHLRTRADVTGAAWDDEAQRWTVETTAGTFSTRVLISGAGALSDPQMPKLPGLESFQGRVFHSATWDHGHDLTGERVGVIGTGASAIQFVPEIQPKVAALTLFQRTPPWVMPRRDRVITQAERWAYRHVPGAQTLSRRAIYWGRETFAIGFTRRPDILKFPEKLALQNLHKAVADPGLRAKLTPNYRMGCKRILISNDYYPALAQPNVDVVTSGIAEVLPHGIRTADGVEHPLDTLIFGTGFQVTDLPIARHIRGRDGRTLAEAWGGLMRAYRGTTMDGFPNLFLLVGPNTGLGHTSQVFMIEQQAAYIGTLLTRLRTSGAGSIEVRADAVAAYDEEVQERMSHTVWTTGGCASWYLDAAGRNTTLWPDFTFRFRQYLHRPDPDAYVLHPAVPAGGAPQAEAA